MGKDAQFSRDSQPQVRSSSKMIIFIASHKIGRFLARLFPAAEGFRATPPHNAEVSFSRSAPPRCSVCVWTHCRCERCRATRSNALDSCSPPSFRSITKSKKKKSKQFLFCFFNFFLLSPLSINAHCKNPFFSSCTMGNWIEFRAGINVFAPSLPSSPLPPCLNFIFFSTGLQCCCFLTGRQRLLRLSGQIHRQPNQGCSHSRCLHLPAALQLLAAKHHANLSPCLSCLTPQMSRTTTCSAAPICPTPFNG